MTFTPYTIDPALDLVLEREVDVAPELVYKAWTTPELVKQWFAPRPSETPLVEIDLRPGGKFRSIMKAPADCEPAGFEVDNTGCYLEVVPDETLSWTSCLGEDFRPGTSAAATGGDALQMTAIIELASNGKGGTRHRAIAPHSSEDDRKRHEDMGFEEGWGQVPTQLVEVMKAQ